MPGRISLSPLEGDLHGELHEAGAERLVTLLNGLRDDGELYVSRDRALPEVSRAIARLIQLGLVSLCREERAGWAPVSSEEVPTLLRLDTLFTWDAERRWWVPTDEAARGLSLCLERES